MLERVGILFRLGGLAACVLVTALYVRSFWMIDEISATDKAGVTRAACVMQGKVHFIRTGVGGPARRWAHDAYPITRDVTGWDLHRMVPEREVLGFARLRRAAAGGAAGYAVPLRLPLLPWLAGAAYDAWVIPGWPVLLLAWLMFPGPWLWRTGRRWWWGRHNRCLGCGYDLRASGARCSECGLRRGGRWWRRPASVVGI